MAKAKTKKEESTDLDTLNEQEFQNAEHESADTEVKVEEPKVTGENDHLSELQKQGVKTHFTNLTDEDLNLIRCEVRARAIATTGKSHAQFDEVVDGMPC